MFVHRRSARVIVAESFCTSEMPVQTITHNGLNASQVTFVRGIRALEQGADQLDDHA